MKLQVVLLVIVTASFLSSVNCQECYPVPYTPPCVCVMSDGKNKGFLIDLRSIARHNGTAAFKASGGQVDTYSYNPCYGFTDGECVNVAGCLNSKTTLGVQAEAKIQTNDDGDVFIAYGGDGGYDQPHMVVNLICKEDDKTGTLEFVGQTEQNQYIFTLTTESACPGICDGGGGGRGDGY